MNEQKLLGLFKEKKALLEGHFLLSSGLHSDRYFQSALLLQYPDIATKLGKLIAEKFIERVDAVVSPALGGLIIGQEVARAKKCRAIFTERGNGQMALRRGFQICPQEKVLVIEDGLDIVISVPENYDENSQLYIDKIVKAIRNKFLPAKLPLGFGEVFEEAQRVWDNVLARGREYGFGSPVQGV